MIYYNISKHQHRCFEKLAQCESMFRYNYLKVHLTDGFNKFEIKKQHINKYLLSYIQVQRLNDIIY